MHWLALLATLISSVTFARASTYTVTATRLNQQQPVISSKLYDRFSPGGSAFLYNYNAAWVPRFNDTTGCPGALLVRAQSNGTGDGSLTPSYLALAKVIGDFGDLDQIAFEPITFADVVVAPYNNASERGTEDPRVTYNPKDGLYYITYTEYGVDNNGDTLVRLALITTADPWDKDSYTYYGPRFDFDTKSGSILLRDQPPHYLFFNDDGIKVATTDNLINYTLVNSSWIYMRNNSFDSWLCEGGPLPLPLSDGNLLYVYNSAQQGNFPVNKFQYNVGWAVLDGGDPTSIIQRADVPLLSPELPWETGVPGELGLTPNVVFLEGWTPGPKPDTFIAFYGAADSVIGAVSISVTIS